MARNIFVLVLVALLAGIAIYQYIDTNNSEATLPVEQAPEVNFDAPHFALEGLDGQTYTIDGPRDKHVLINFWASWCGPCHEEAPDLNKLYEKHSDRLDIYAVNVTEWDTVPDAIKFVEEYDFQFPVLLDEDNVVTPLYKVRSYPTNLLVDPNGVVVEHFKWMLMDNEIKKIEKHLK